MARHSSSPKILGGLAPGPIHVSQTISVIKTGNLHKSGAQPQTGGPGPPGPSVELRLHTATE